MTDLAKIMGEVAKELWGEPSRQHSTETELRWGTHGARSVNLAKGTWFDHEGKQGGGVVDLLKREGVRDASVWLDAHGFTNGEYRAGTRWKIAAIYSYCDEGGELLFEVVRFDNPKDFRQRRKAISDDPTDKVRDGWRWSVKDVRQVPYRLPELLEAVALERPIYIPEGEKDVETLRRHGLDATCNAGGSGKWRPEFAEFLTGANVIILPDNDHAGLKHGQEIARSLIGKAKRIRVVALPGLPEKGDVSDWFVTKDNTVETFNVLVEAAPDWDVQTPAPSPSRCINLAKYDTEPIRLREWTVHDRFPRRNVGLLSGEGGLGKSILLLQLAVAHVLARDWLRSVPIKGPVIVVACEDEEDEIARRLTPILDHYGATFADVAPDLHVRALAGEDSLMATLQHDGRLVGTDLYQEILAMAHDIKPVCVIIDNVADVFGGSEIDRAQVRQFIALMRRIAVAGDGAFVALSAHPSLTGISSKTGLSGSTAWHNSVRARAFLHGVKPENGDPPDPDLRELEFMKNNYGKLAETVPLKWQNGLFAPIPRKRFLDQIRSHTESNDIFFVLLDKYTVANRLVSDKPTSNNYAPTLFAKEEEAKAKQATKHELEDAMRRLFSTGAILNEPYGPPSKNTSKIVRRRAE